MPTVTALQMLQTHASTKWEPVRLGAMLNAGTEIGAEVTDGFFSIHPAVVMKVVKIISSAFWGLHPALSQAGAALQLQDGDLCFQKGSLSSTMKLRAFYLQICSAESIHIGGAQ